MSRVPEIPQDRNVFATAMPANDAAEAIFAILWAVKRRLLTIQWMREELGCRFEIIHVDGDMVGVVRVAKDGSVTLERCVRDD